MKGMPVCPVRICHDLKLYRTVPHTASEVTTQDKEGSHRGFIFRVSLNINESLYNGSSQGKKDSIILYIIQTELQDYS